MSSWRVVQQLGKGCDGWLIQADNLAALHALKATHEGRVKLVYLDPPYNTGQRFDYYDDHRETDDWSAMIRPRLEAIKPLLHPRGVVVAQIDKTEQATLRVLMDEVFGRRSFVTTVAVRMSGTSGFKIEHTEKTIVKNTEFLHVYSADLDLVSRAYEPSMFFDSHYSYRMHGTPLRCERLVHSPAVAALLEQFGLRPVDRSLTTLYARSERFRYWVAAHGDEICRSHTAPAGAKRQLAAGELRFTEPGEVLQRDYGANHYWLRATRSGVDQLIPLSLKLQWVDRTGSPDEQMLTNILGDWWDGFHLDMGNVENEGQVPFKNGKKPERLLRRLIRMLTRPGDLVLDPFAGSGTTASVAHKMRRSWIAIEVLEQATSHALPRLARVVQGEDDTGITSAEHWTGGGGFELRRLP